MLHGVTIDNGGSQVRSLGVDAPIEEIVLMDNDFVKIDSSKFRYKEVENPDKVINVVKAPLKDYEILMGQGITGRQYEGESISISSQSSKTDNVNYYRQLIFTLALEAFNTINKRGYIAEDPDKIQHIDFVLCTCIPVKEHSGNKDCAALLKDRLCGDYTIEFPLVTSGFRSLTFSIVPEYVGVLPEGGVTISIFGKDTFSSDDLSIVIDMGHVSTDIAIFKGRSILGGKTSSSRFAGSTLNAAVRAALQDEGYFLNDEQVQSVLRTGKVRVGSKFVDVSDEINKQKEIFVANFIAPEIVQILNLNGINAMQIQNVIPIGAPMNCDEDFDNSIPAMITKQCHLDNAELRIVKGDLRFANLVATSMFTKALFAKAVQAE